MKVTTARWVGFVIAALIMWTLCAWIQPTNLLELAILGSFSAGAAFWIMVALFDHP